MQPAIKRNTCFASQYQFHLPTETELEEELKREINEIVGFMEPDQNKETMAFKVYDTVESD